MSKKFFWGKKYLLVSGREADISSEEEKAGFISVLAILNHFDPIHEITKPLSIRLEWEKEESDPVVSIECRGGAPQNNRPVSESEMPVEGLNGAKEKLQISEVLELIEAMKNFHSKIREEIKTKA